MQGANHFSQLSFSSWTTNWDDRGRDGSILEKAAEQGDVEAIEKYLSSPENEIAVDELNSALVSAVRHGHAEAVVKLCNRGADWRTPVDIFGNVLGLAACAGSIPVLEGLLKCGADLGESIKDGKNPLVAAAFYNEDDAMLNFLRGLGCSLNQPDRKGRLPLVDAVYKGSLPIVKSLMAAGADPHMREKCDKGQSAFWLALDRNDDGIARYMVSADDMSLDCEKIRELTKALFDAVAVGAKRNVEDVLGQIPALVNVRNRKGYAPFQVAVCSGHMDMAEYLSRCGADIDALTVCGGSMLHMMCAQQKFDAVRRLIALKIDLELQDENGLTALHYAAMCCGEQFVLEMLRLPGLSNHLAAFSLAPFFGAKPEEKARCADLLVLALIGQEFIAALMPDSSDRFVMDMVSLIDARTSYDRIMAGLNCLSGDKIANILASIVFASQAVYDMKLGDPRGLHLERLIRLQDLDCSPDTRSAVRIMTLTALGQVGLDFSVDTFGIDDKGLPDPKSISYDRFCRLPKLTQGLLAELLA